MSTRPDIHIPSELQVPRGATTRGDGIVVGSGSIPIDIFIDFLCPFCKQFEERSSGRLDRLVFEGAVSLIYHPLGLLDRPEPCRPAELVTQTLGLADLPAALTMTMRLTVLF